jgi:hypothetical protein
MPAIRPLLTVIELRTKIIVSAFILMAHLVGTGCTSGFVYTNVIRPLSTDMDQTPLGGKTFAINSKRIQEPLTGFDLSAEWDSRAIGDAARNGGLTTVYFADLQTISVLGGLWKQQIIRVRGD